MKKDPLSHPFRKPTFWGVQTHTFRSYDWSMAWKTKATLQEINISHLGKRKIIFKMDFSGDMLVPRRVVPHSFPRLVSFCCLHGSKLLMHPCFFNQGFFHDRLAPGEIRGGFHPVFGGKFPRSFFGGGNQQKDPNHWEDNWVKV